MEFQMNIGLNNNPLSMHDIATILKNTPGMRSFQFKHTDSMYNDIDEPTMVVIGRFDISFDFENQVKALCMMLTQECIAVLTTTFCSTEGKLIYNPEFKGKKQSFDMKYFVKF